MALKQQQKAEIKEVFGDRMSTGLLINLLTIFPKLLEAIMEIIKVFKANKAKANKIMDDPIKPDPGTTPPPPQ